MSLGFVTWVPWYAQVRVPVLVWGVAAPAGVVVGESGCCGVVEVAIVVVVVVATGVWLGAVVVVVGRS